MPVNEAKLKNALGWFSNKIQSFFDTKPKEKKKAEDMDLYDMEDVVKKTSFFHLYMHIYAKPKYEEELPYWDKLPLYFPVELKGSGHGSGAKICGLNIHYLRPEARIKFMEEVKKEIIFGMERTGYNPDEEGFKELPMAMLTKFVSKRINGVYLGLFGSEGEKKIKMAYRMYLVDRIGSQIKRIPLSQWEDAAHTVLPSFAKESAGAVWKDIDVLYNKYSSSNWSSLI